MESPPGNVTVLRLGHRPSRDKRVSTHLLLAARAFGAEAGIYTGDQDDSLEESIRLVVEEWGGGFTVTHSERYRRVIKEWDGKIVHLTMYGLPVQDAMSEIKADPSRKLVVVGGAKVPGDVYGMANWNVSVTTQPHSEVSALAIFLHMYYDGRMLAHEFSDAKMRIKPMPHGKAFERVE